MDKQNFLGSFCLVFHKYLKYPLSEQISAAFAKFDETGNGKLNYVEFCGMMNRSKNKEKDKGGGGGKTLASGSSSGAPR